MRNGILLALHHGLTEEMLSHIHDSCTVFINQYS